MATNNNNIDNYLFSSSSPFAPLPRRAPAPAAAPHKNPRKRRSKFLRLSAAGDAAAAPKPKPAKKPDPSAPKITPPCTECGRRFWSHKALFGHMRCHPERLWRGIRPPAAAAAAADAEYYSFSLTEDDHDAAASLLLLANGPPASSSTTTTTTAAAAASTLEHSDAAAKFECSSCKKVFGSHQALGGHRASHKNVKGCYAITKNCGGEEEEEEEEEGGGCCSSGEAMVMICGHKCSICFRVFSSGQALGGHMRCHWENRAEELPPAARVCDFDLNLAAAPPLQEEDEASSPPLALELRLGF